MIKKYTAPSQPPKLLDQVRERAAGEALQRPHRALAHSANIPELHYFTSTATSEDLGRFDGDVVAQINGDGLFGGYRSAG